MSNENPVYISNIKIKSEKGAIRHAFLPPDNNEVIFGVHNEIAEHYGTTASSLTDPMPTTLDYIIAATGAWMLGTIRRALAVREIPSGREYLTADTEGEVFKEKNNVLKIRNISILYNLTIQKELFDEKKEAIERTMKHHASQCPVHLSIGDSINITTEIQFKFLN